MTCGRDVGAPVSTIIGSLISFTLQSTAAIPMQRLFASGRLERAELELGRARLRTIVADDGSLANSLKGEYDSIQSYLERWTDPNRDEARLIQEGRTFYQEPAAVERLRGDPQAALAEFLRLRVQFETYYNAPFSRRDHAGFDALVRQLRSMPWPFRGIVDPKEPDVRARRMKTLVDAADLAASLELYRLDRGTLPERLEELVPDYEAALPADPFTGQPFRYDVAPDRRSYRLWSPGPELIDNQALVTYDPTNGTVSGGDLILMN
jgi:hypothetical protein